MVNFINDIIVGTEIEEEYNKIVKEVVRRLVENNLYIKLEECKWKVQKVEFLGVVIGLEGIKMKDEKIKNILSSSQMVDLVFLYFTFYFYFIFDLFFYFLFLEQLGLGLISHAVTSVTIWWHSHKTDHRTWENLVEDLRTNDVLQHRHHMLASWTIHSCLG